MTVGGGGGSVSFAIEAERLVADLTDAHMIGEPATAGAARA